MNHGERVFMKRILVVTLPLCLALLIASPSLVGLGLRLRDANQIVDGWHEAAEEGCLNCHLPAGGQSIPNPGSQWMTVPPWSAGIMRIYVTTDSEIIEYIQNGLPDRKRKDPEALRQYEGQLIQMPAFGSHESEREILALAACAKAFSSQGAPGGSAGEGHEVAAEHRCFACHGPAGYGGMPNGVSIAGVIAGWAGPGFHDLVRSKDEFGEWIRTGHSKRMDQNPVARFFLERQRIEMPAYEKVLNASEIDRLWDYVQWLRTSSGFSVNR
jgi:hypothetical protein